MFHEPYLLIWQIEFVLPDTWMELQSPDAQKSGIIRLLADSRQAMKKLNDQD